MNQNAEGQLIAVLVIVVILVIVFYRRRWRGSGTAFGTANWMSDKMMRAAGMLAGYGLVLGRTFGGALIRLPDYCHVLVCGGSGSGKGVSIVIPNLLMYNRGSIVCFDTKSDLFTTTAQRRSASGERIIRLAPFGSGEDSFNPLDTIPCNSPMLIDSARAMAEALVARTGAESDPFWNDRAVQVICAVLVLILLKFKNEDRSLNSLQEIASDPELLKASAEHLQKIGDLPRRLGNQLKHLFDKDGSGFTKEGNGVISTVVRHLSFLDSDLVAKAVATSTFDPAELRKPGITLFIQIEPDQLEAQRGLLRCWMAALIRAISAGGEQDSEVLFLLDECSALGSLPALEEALVRGRSSGVRLMMIYQSDSQITATFKTKPTLLYDNCSVQVYLGAASSYETAERLSKALGEYTQVVESYGENESRSQQQGGDSQSGGQSSRGSSLNYSESGRALRRPDELLTQSNDILIALLRGMSPILAERVFWYADREFNPKAKKRRRRRRLTASWLVWLALIVAFVILVIRAKVNGYGYWSP